MGLKRTKIKHYKGEPKMSKKWYGNLNNRLEENKSFVDEIKVGTKLTEYHWSDRTPWEVIAVEDQKHITVRMMNHRPAPNSQSMSNDWEIFSDETMPTMKLAKRGKYWYMVFTGTKEMLEGDEKTVKQNRLYMLNHGISIEDVKEKGRVEKFSRINVSFGKAEYYYDYEF
jgi:hypothetical protein